MRSRIPQKLGDVLSVLIDRAGLTRGIDEARAIEAWDEVVNQPLRAVTEKVWVSNGVMHVKITSSTWRAELQFEKTAWCEKINRHIGKKVIRSIQFR